MPIRRAALCVVLCVLTSLLLAGCSPAGESRAGEYPASKAIPTFDADRAFDLLEQQVRIGPRYPGSPGHSTMVEFMMAQLKPHVDSLESRKFATTAEGRSLQLTNVIARVNPKASRHILLAAHWDTRPRADYEIDASRRATPIPGANDGASGVAVLLELARMFAKQKPEVGVVLVMFDGEDYGTTEAGMYLGSKHFAENLDKITDPNGMPARIDYGIVVDMVGDKNLEIYKERNSVEAAPEVVEKVWAAAAKLGHKQFHPQTKYAIGDDHVPLIRKGVKCIDIIDFDYAPWHTLDDAPDKCSPESLRVVGETVAAVVYSER